MESVDPVQNVILSINQQDIRVEELCMTVGATEVYISQEVAWASLYQ